MDELRREDIKGALAVYDAAISAAEEAARPARAALKPFQDEIDRSREARELYLDGLGVEVAGTCETCGKLLFCGEPGQRPFDDDSEIIVCAEHGMTYGNLRSHWQEDWVDESDSYHVEGRAAALKAVDDHLAAGGSLDDIIPGVL